MLNSSKDQDLAPIARLPQGNPVEAIGDYFQSLKEDNIVRKPPLWDFAGRMGNQEKERARLAAEIAEEKLAECRTNQIARRRQLDTRWESLKQRQLKLRQSFIKFNKFVHENQDKRVRAANKMADDSKALKTKSEETEAIGKDLQEMTEVCEEMESYLKKHTMYEDYLMSVVALKHYFHQPTDILNRFETLTSAKKTLSERQVRDLDRMVAIRSEMNVLMENTTLQMMGLNNTLAGLRSRLDSARNESRKWELVLNRVKETTAEKQVELSRVRDSLWDFYCTICKQKGMEPTAEYDDFDTQLIYVFKGIKELRNIVINSKKKMENNVASNVAHSSRMFNY